MARIELRPLGRGRYATVDEDLFEELNKVTWHYRHGYVAHPYRVGGAGSTQKLLFMHRIVNQTPEGSYTDHINGDRLDNRRANLRTVDLRHNAQNVGTKPTNTSGYIGVHWWSRDRKWKASITHDGKNYNFGYFETKEKAALVFNLMAKIIRGEYARLNNIQGMSIDEQQQFIVYWLHEKCSARDKLIQEANGTH